MSLKNKHIPWYTPVVIILSFMVYCLEIDLAVPSFPFITKGLKTTETLMQLTMSLNFLGFCLAALLYGPLSDSFGRRKTLLIGCSIYVLGGLGCAMMNSIESLLLFRFVQGLGASSGCVILYAMIADIYPSEKVAWFHGVMNATLTVTMAGAPIAGSFINDSYGWRYNLITIAALSVLTLVMMFFILPETLEKKRKWHLGSIMKDYLALLTSKEFVLLTAGPSILVGVYLTFVSVASFFYQTQLGLSTVTFGMHQMVVLLSFSLISVFTGKINQKLGIKNSIIYGNVVMLIGAALLFWIGKQPLFYPHSITLFMSVLVMGVALAFGSTIAIAFNVMPEIAGAASSLIMSSRLLFASGMVAYTSKVYDGTWYTVAQVLFVGSALGALLITFGIRLSKSDLLK